MLRTPGLWSSNSVLLCVCFPGGSGFSPVRLSRRDAGSDLQRDQEALLRPLVQGGRELHGRGLGGREGGLEAEGNEESLMLSARVDMYYWWVMKDSAFQSMGTAARVAESMFFFQGWQHFGSILNNEPWLKWCTGSQRSCPLLSSESWSVFLFGDPLMWQHQHK